MLSTEHSTRRFGSDCPRRIILAAFHVGSKRNGGGVTSCVNVGWPFTVAASERGGRFLLRRSFQSSAVRPEVPAQETVSPVTRFATIHAPQPYPMDIASSVRDKIPSTPLDGVASSSICTANIFASPREASNTQLVTTSRSSYSGGGIDGTTSAVARSVVASVIVHSPSPSIAAPAHIDPRQRLARREKLVGDGDEVILKASPLTARWDVRI